VPAYRVGDAGATVFDEHGRLLAQLRPGAVVVPGSVDETTEPRTPEQSHPIRRGYADKVIRHDEDASA
jgi:hypothetical protein